MKNFKLILIVLIIPIFGYSTTYTSTADGSWSSSSTWSGSGTPDVDQWPNDVVIINHDVTYTGNLSAWSSSGWHTIITINSGASLTISGTMYVNAGEVDIKSGGTVTAGGLVTVTTNGDLTVEGTLNADAGLSVSASGSVYSDTGSDINVTGNLTTNGTQSSTFNGDLDVSGDVFSGGGPTNVYYGGDITIVGDFNGTGNGVITTGGTLSIGGDLDLCCNSYMEGSGVVSWSTIDVYGPGASYIKCTDGSRYDSHAGAPYSDPPGNPFDLTACSAVLPVELQYFNVAANKNGMVNINWTTASELNNDYFEVQRSINGYDFETIDVVSGAGNSTSTIDYSTTDFNAPSGHVYYRLQQVDYDNTAEVFKMKSIFNETTTEVAISMTKVGTETYLELSGELTDLNDPMIFTIQGKLLSVNMQLVGENKRIKKYKIDQPLTAGSFLVRVQNDVSVYSSNVVLY